MRGWRGPTTAILVLAVASLAGCTLLDLTSPTPDPEAGPGFARDCAPPFAFEDITTLAALRLPQFEGLGDDLARRGTIRITEATIRWEDFAPPEVPALVDEGQLLCVTWPDGSGMATLLHQPFRAGGVEGDGGETPAQLPVGPIVAAIIVVAMAGIGWLAFREQGR